MVRSMLLAATLAATLISSWIGEAHAQGVIPDAIGNALRGNGDSCIASNSALEDQVRPIVMEGMHRYLTMAAAGGAQDYESLFLMTTGRPTWVRRDATGETRKANRHSFQTIDDPL